MQFYFLASYDSKSFQDFEIFVQKNQSKPWLGHAWKEKPARIEKSEQVIYGEPSVCGVLRKPKKCDF